MRIVAGEGDGLGAIHPPPVPDDLATPAALAEQVGGLVEEIATRRHARDVDALESLDSQAQANREMGLGPAQLTESERARALELYRDRVSLERQFDRWFPEVRKVDAVVGETDADVDAVVVVLSTIAETLGVIGGTSLARMADAIDLLERLLPDARLTPARYDAVVAHGDAALASPMNAVRHEAHRDQSSIKTSATPGGTS